MSNNAVKAAGSLDSPSTVQSVDRAITIMEILARNGEVGVTELAAELGVHKSTAFRLVAALDPGATANVEVVRDGKRMLLKVALSERRDTVVTASLPQTRSDLKLGIDVQDLTAGLAEKFHLKESRGVLISKVETGSLAQAEGLREGDLVKEVNRVDTGSVGEFTIAVSKVKRGETILLRVLREGRAFYVVLKPADP